MKRDEDVIKVAPMTPARIQWHRANIEAERLYVAVLIELGLDPAHALARIHRYTTDVNDWEMEIT